MVVPGETPTPSHGQTCFQTWSTWFVAGLNYDANPTTQCAFRNGHREKQTSDPSAAPNARCGSVPVRTDSGTTRAGIAPAVPDTRTSTGTAGAGEDMQG